MQRLAASQVDWPTVAGLTVKCRRSAEFCGPATFRAFTCDGKWPCSALRCRRSGGKVSQVGRILRTCDVPCVHLRRKTATQCPAVSQVTPQTVAGHPANCRRSVFFRSPATGNGHPVPCSVAGRPVHCRRFGGNLSQVGRILRTCDVPCTNLQNTTCSMGKLQRFYIWVRMGVGCRGDSGPLHSGPLHSGPLHSGPKSAKQPPNHKNWVWGLQGAQSGNRTRTVLLPQDFESSASTNSAIRAWWTANVTQKRGIAKFFIYLCNAAKNTAI